jgi:hypothetical protein
MANNIYPRDATLQDLPAGAFALVLDTTDTTTGYVFQSGATGRVASYVLTVEGAGWTGNITFQGRAIGAGANGVAFQSLAYQNLASGADVAAGSPITATGTYALRTDFMECRLIWTITAGTVKVSGYGGAG